MKTAEGAEGTEKNEEECFGTGIKINSLLRVEDKKEF
jgi:hypothetical protein